MLTFLDANCRMGPRMGVPSTLPQQPEQLEEQYRRFGVEWGLCTHGWSEEYDALEGNLRMEAIAAEHPAFGVCASVLPRSSDQFPGVDDLPAHLDAVKALAARISPRLHGFEAIPTVLGEVFEVLVAREMPLIVAYTEIGWRDLDQLLGDFPKLVVILEGLGYRDDRTLFPLMARHPGLRIETSRYVGHKALESIADRFGVHRLLFGSGLPVSTPSAPIGRVLFADLSDADKHAIAYGNLSELVGTRVVAS